MSQIVLDEHVSAPEVLEALEKWITVVPLQALRPGENVRDDRVPAIFLTLKQPTLVTIDHGFWNRKLCHPRYCILYFPLDSEQQYLIPDLLRRTLHLPAFSTRAVRMGKVARISQVGIEYWQFQSHELVEIAWEERPRKKKR